MLKYQAQNTGKVESQFDMLKRLELSYEDFRSVKVYCDKIGIQFCSTADDFESLDKELELAKGRNELSFIEVKCSIGARDDLGRPTTTALENKQMFMNYLMDS